MSVSKMKYIRYLSMQNFLRRKMQAEERPYVTRAMLYTRRISGEVVKFRPRGPRPVLNEKAMHAIDNSQSARVWEHLAVLGRAVADKDEEA
jgi:hypothetical protein